MRSLLSFPGRVAETGLTVLFFAVFLLFDLREGGPASSLTTWHIVTPAHYARLFGTDYVVGAIVLDAVLAAATAWCLMIGIEGWRRRRGALGAGCAPGAVVVLGVSLFGCPGCVLPLAGTLGITAVAIDLPLYGLEFKLLALALVLVAGLLSRRRLNRPSARSPIVPA